MNTKSVNACSEPMKMNPKHADSALIEELVREVERLSLRASSLGGRVEMVYMMDRISRRDGGGLIVETDFEPRVGLGYAKRRAQELKIEAEKELAERNIAPKDPAPFPGGDRSCTAFIENIQYLAFQVEHAASQALRSPLETRPDFIKAFFSRVKALDDRLKDTAGII